MSSMSSKLTLLQMRKAKALEEFAAEERLINSEMALEHSDEQKSPVNLVIVGGVAGGASVAARARRLNEFANIILLEKGAAVSFANCGLPYYIGGEIKNPEVLQIHTPASLSKLLNIDIRVNTMATEIDRVNKMLKTVNTLTNEVTLIPYDKLVLSPGAFPFVPPGKFSGDRIFSLRTLEDMHAIKALVLTEDIKDVAIIGAGFIGLEMAEQLINIKKNVLLIEAAKHVLSMMDEEMVSSVTASLIANGVDLMCSKGVKGINHVDNKLVIDFGADSYMKVDLVLLCIGIRPENALAKTAGLTLSQSGHVVVNQYQQTSDADIYAVGDVAITADGVFPDKQLSAALGGPANRCGRVAADHIFAPELVTAYPGSLGTAIIRVFGAVTGMVGWTEKRLQRDNIPYMQTTLTGNNRASWFPDAKPLTVKITWSPDTGKLLGGQCFGADGVDKRLDVLAMALRGKMTVEDLMHVELAYAPPFNAAKDPINFIGFMAMNQRTGLVKNCLSLVGFEQVVDVRPEKAVKAKPIEHADANCPVICIPMAQLRARINELDKTKRTVTVCNVGKMSYFASRVLKQNGFIVESLEGGMSGGVSHVSVTCESNRVLEEEAAVINELQNTHVMGKHPIEHAPCQ